MEQTHKHDLLIGGYSYTVSGKKVTP